MVDPIHSEDLITSEPDALTEQPRPLMTMLLVAVCIHGLFLLVPLSRGESEQVGDAEETVEVTEEKSVAFPKLKAEPDQKVLNKDLEKKAKDAKVLNVDPSDPATSLTSHNKPATSVSTNSLRSRASSSTRRSSAYSSYTSRQSRSSSAQRSNASRTVASAQSSPTPVQTAPSTSNPPSKAITPSTVPNAPDTAIAPIPVINESDYLGDPEPVITKTTAPSNLTPEERFKRDFPYYFQANITSGTLLKPEYDTSDYIFHTEDEMGTVSDTFESKLAANNFGFDLEAEDNDFKQYQISRDGVVKYLHLLTHGERTTILLTQTAHNKDDLLQDQSDAQWLSLADFYIAMKSELVNDGELALQDIQDTDFALFSQLEAVHPTNAEQSITEPGYFFVDRLQLITPPAASISTDELSESITDRLKQESYQFKVQKVEGFAGGELYEVTREDFKIYLVLVSTESQDNTRTALLSTMSDPRK